MAKSPSLPSTENHHIANPPRQTMRVVVVTNMYPSPSQPFFGSFVQNQVSELRALGVEVLVIAKSPTTKRGLATLPAYLGLYFRTIFHGFRFHPHIIHSHFIFPTTPGAIVLKWIARVPLVVTSHRGDVFDIPYVSKKFLFLTRYCIHKADLIVAVSSEIEHQIRDVLNCYSTPIRILDMGFRFPNGQNQPTPTRKRRSILFVGLSFERKGGYDLLAAIRDLKKQHPTPFTVTFVGEFPDQAKIYVKENHLHDVVEVLGKIPHHEISSAFDQHEIFVLPSYSEGLPVAMLEAMAKGLAVISTPVGDVAETIGNGEGVLVEAGDVNALTEALYKLLTDHALLEHLSHSAVMKSKEYTSNQKAQKLTTFYRELISSTG